MSVLITPSVEKLLDDIKAQPECLSVELKEVPEILLNQINDNNTVMYSCSFEKSKKIDVDIIFNVDYLAEREPMGKSIVDDLVFCEHPDKTITGCIHSIHENRGKPTYYARPSDSFGQRLVAEYPEPLPDSEALRELLDKISKIPDVARVTADRIVSQELKDMVNCPNNNGIIFYVEDETAHDWRVGNYEENKTNCYWFVYPESIWSNPVTFDKAIEAIEQSFIAHRTGQPYPGKK